MAIRIERLNIIVPIEKINSIFPGVFSGFVQKNRRNFGGTIWYDDFLLREGALTPVELKKQLSVWESIGFKKDEDICVVSDVPGVTQSKCDWMVFGPNRAYVYMAGHEQGEIIGRVEMQRILSQENE